jgi:cytochrome c-type biogenesis protein CcmH/NrfG
VAQKLAEAVLKRNPDSVDGLLALGMALRGQRKFEEAKRALARALSLSPEYTDILIVLGGIAEQENRNTEAIRDYDRALRLDPGNKGLRQRRDRLGKGGNG